MFAPIREAKDYFNLERSPEKGKLQHILSVAGPHTTLRFRPAVALLHRYPQLRGDP